MVSTPLRLPVAVGRKLTRTAQLAFTAIGELVQLSVSLKSPVTVTLLTVREALPVLVTVMVCAELAVATGCGPNVSDTGLRLIAGWVALAAVSNGICQIPRP
jgi:hypothetical protein